MTSSAQAPAETMALDAPPRPRWAKRLNVLGLLAVGAFAVAFPLIFVSPATTSIAVFTLIYVIAASGWNIFSGYSGYISLGHTTFYGIGQYAVGLIAVHLSVSSGVGLFALLPLGGVIAAIAAVPIGLVMLRTRTHTFIILSIAVLFIFQLFAFNLHSFTMGSLGIQVPQPPWQGGGFNVPFYYAALVAVGIAALTSWLVRRSRFGLGLRAVRDDEDRALGLGTHSTRDALGAFVISGFFVGVAGGIYALFVGAVYPQFAFDPAFSIYIVVMAFAGGAGTVAGPIIGVLLFEPLQQYLQLQISDSSSFLIAYGIIFILILRLLPTGIVPQLTALSKRLLAGREPEWRVGGSRGFGEQQVDPAPGEGAP